MQSDADRQLGIDAPCDRNARIPSVGTRPDRWRRGDEHARTALSQKALVGISPAFGSGGLASSPKRRRPDRHLRRTSDGQDSPMSGDVDSLLLRRRRSHGALAPASVSGRSEAEGGSQLRRSVLWLLVRETRSGVLVPSDARLSRNAQAGERRSATVGSRPMGVRRKRNPVVARGESFAEVAHEPPGSNDTQVDEVLDCVAPSAPCGAPASHRLRDCVSTQSRLAAGRCTKDNDIPTLPLRSAAGGDRATRDSGLSLRVAGPRCRPGYPRSTVGACSERSQERRWCPKPRPAVENL
jgi:hypothetical protein